MEEKFNKDDTFLARWLSGELSAEELQEFEAYDDFESFKKIAETTSELNTPTWKNKEDAWKSFKTKTETIQKEPIAKVRKLNRRWMLTVAAAIGLLLLGYFAFFQNTTQIFSTPIASQKTFTLPDGSEVILNALSKIEFDKKDFMENRTLILEGEAFFKVEKGSRFLVETPTGSVQVLGTSFNVFSRKNKLNVNCYTGKVGVFFGKSNEMEELNPNEALVVVNKKIIQHLYNETGNAPDWATGNSKFSKVDFIEVIEEMERQFDIKIDYPNELEKIYDYNGGFPHDDLETALRIVFPSIGYQYKINGKEVTVFK